MRTRYSELSWFGLIGLLLISFPVFPQEVQGKWPNSHNDCSGNCFSAEVVSAVPGEGGCTDYEIRVSHDGTCRYELSHVTIEMPCGTVSNVKAPGGCGNDFGKDPTTGLKGLKISPRNFGKGLPYFFTVKFTWCNNSACNTSDCWEPRVAFKAATCVDIDTAKNSCRNTPPPLKATVQNHPVSCGGNPDGTLSVAAEGGAGPYTFVWSTGCTLSSIDNLPEGTYSVTITDTNGTQVTVTEEVKATSNMVLTATTVNPKCSFQQNGSIDLSVTGGVEPYTYAWSNGMATQDLANLPAGSYRVVVTDSTGCSKDAVFQLTNTIISISAVPIRPGCGQMNGQLDITVTGGVGPYTYRWNNGSTSEDISALAAGSYNVLVTDANGCTAASSFFLSENNSLHISFVVTPTSCVDNSSGAINLTVTGGTAPYRYAWQNGATTEDVTGLPAGLQRVTVTDAGGCTATSIINVFKQSFPVASQAIPPSCTGTQDGSITLTPNGVPPYTYLWSNGSIENSITNLSSGLYTVTVTDASGCSQQLNYFLSDPVINAFTTVTNPQCGAEGSFSINLTVSGGVAPYSYTWSNGEMTEDISGLNSGTYQVRITDSKGCGKTVDVIVQPFVIDWACSINPPTGNPVCGSPGNQLGTAVTGATYLWSVESQDSQWTITSGAQSSTVTYLAGGNGTVATFSLTVTKNGCSQTCSYTLAGCSPVMTCGMDSTASATPPITSNPASKTEESNREPGNTSKPEFRLAAYPNPITSSFSIDWKAEANEYVRVELMDLFGKRVAELYSGNVREGEDYRITWNASELTDRWYVYRYTSGTRTVYGKVLKAN